MGHYSSKHHHQQSLITNKSAVATAATAASTSIVSCDTTRSSTISNLEVNCSDDNGFDGVGIDSRQLTTKPNSRVKQSSSSVLEQKRRKKTEKTKRPPHHSISDLRCENITVNNNDYDTTVAATKSNGKSRKVKVTETRLNKLLNTGQPSIPIDIANTSSSSVLVQQPQRQQQQQKFDSLTSTGSVVITIRLLKMESPRLSLSSGGGNHHSHTSTQQTSLRQPAIGQLTNNNNENLTEISVINVNNNDGDIANSIVTAKTIVTNNRIGNSEKDNFKNIYNNANSNANDDYDDDDDNDLIATMTHSALSNNNCNGSSYDLISSNINNNNNPNSNNCKNSSSNLPSKITHICDKTSNSTVTMLPVLRRSIENSFNSKSIELNNGNGVCAAKDSISCMQNENNIDFAATTSTATPIPEKSSDLMEMSSVAATTIVHEPHSGFIPSTMNIISTVSPYPHHIPIANFLHQSPNDRAKKVAHANNHCCGKVGASKDGPKEAKSKKQNWSIKFNCPKLKSIKSLSLSPSSTSNSGGSASSQNSPSGMASPSSSAPINAPLLTHLPHIKLPTLCVEDSKSSSLNSSASSNCSSTSSPPIFPGISTTMPATTTNASTTLVLDKSALFSAGSGNVILVTMDQPLLDFSRFNPDDYPIEDCDKKARLQRAFEIAEGVDPPPGFMSTSSFNTTIHSMPSPSLQLLPATATVDSLPSNAISTSSVVNGSNDVATAAAAAAAATATQHWHMVCSNNAALRFMLPNILHHPEDIPRIHSQVDYIHCLVPDLKKITNCTFYWGKMDRYEAERLLENKPEGTFLLRDSAQEEYLFSVSFRKYGRSLHARIEQFNHKFSFDCHDPGVYTSSTVTGLLEHYKDPACVMFFEPALTLPLNRNFVFSLQQLCRATIVSHTTYDGINNICLPKKLKSYLKEYHYKQRVRVKRFDDAFYSAS